MFHVCWERDGKKFRRFTSAKPILPLDIVDFVFLYVCEKEIKLIFF